MLSFQFHSWSNKLSNLIFKYFLIYLYYIKIIIQIPNIIYHNFIIVRSMNP